MAQQCFSVAPRPAADPLPPRTPPQGHHADATAEPSAQQQLLRKGSVDVDPDAYPGQPETASVGGVPTVL